MVAISDATAKLPSLTDKSANVNLAWKKIILDICLGHLNDALNAQQQTSKKLASRPSRASQLPSPDSIHLLDTDQLWQSLEFQNKAILPRTKQRLGFLLRKKGNRTVPRHENSDKPERENAEDGKVAPDSIGQKLLDSEESDSEASEDDEDEATDDAGEDAVPEDGTDSASDGVTEELLDLDQKTSQVKKKDNAKERLIQSLEDSIVAPKPWALRGEVPASARPKNSLLDTTFEFDTSRKADVTAIGDLNASIEDLIKRRVADSQFDDIIPQDAPQSSTGGNLKSETGDDDWLSEKPQKGLGELYADEFKESGKSKDSPSSHGDLPAGHHDEKYREIYADFNRLMQKLDALCGYSVTPLVNEDAGPSAEAVPEDIVKGEAIVSLQNNKEGKKRPHGDNESSRKQRKRKRRKKDRSDLQV